MSDAQPRAVLPRPFCRALQTGGAGRSLLVISPGDLKASSAPAVASSDNRAVGGKAAAATNYLGLGQAAFTTVANTVNSQAGGQGAAPPVEAVKEFEDSLTPTQLTVVKALVSAKASSSSSSTSETTTSEGAKESLKDFESSHQMDTPVGQIGLDPAEWKSYTQTMQQQAASDTTTTTSGGKTMPKSVFEHFHNGLTAQQYAAQVAQEKQTEAAAAQAAAAQIAAQPAAAPSNSNSPSPSSSSSSETTTTSGGKENLWLFEAEHQVAQPGPDGGSYGADPAQWRAAIASEEAQWARMYDYDYKQAHQAQQNGQPPSSSTSSETTTTSANGQSLKVPISMYKKFHNGMDPQQVAQQQQQIQQADQQDAQQVEQELANPTSSSSETTTSSGQVESLKLFEANHMFWTPSGGGVGLNPQEWQEYLANEAATQQKEQDYAQKYQDYQKQQNTQQNGGKVTSASTTSSTESTTTGGNTIEVPDYVYSKFHNGNNAQQVQQQQQQLQSSEQQAVAQVVAEASQPPRPATTASTPSASPSPSTDTTTTGGAKEPLAVFEAEHQIWTPVGSFPLDPAQYQKYEDYQTAKAQKEQDYAQKVEVREQRSAASVQQLNAPSGSCGFL